MSNKKLLRLLQEMIKNQMNEALNVDFVANQIGISRMHLHRRIKQLTGMTTSEYIHSIKMEEAAERLLHTQQRVKDIAQDIGYTDSSHFARVFKKQKDCSPREYRMNYSVYYRQEG